MGRTKKLETEQVRISNNTMPGKVAGFVANQLQAGKEVELLFGISPRLSVKAHNVLVIVGRMCKEEGHEVEVVTSLPERIEVEGDKGTTIRVDRVVLRPAK